MPARPPHGSRGGDSRRSGTNDPTLQRVPIDRIVLEPQARRRFDPRTIEELAASIASSGLQQPPLLRRRGESFVPIDGERRVRACTVLDWKELPALVVEESDAADTLTRQLVCNLQREDLNPVDRAEAINSLLRLGSCTREQAAGRLGLSSAAVTRSLAILRLPGALRERVRAGEISADAAYQLSRVADPAEQARLAEEAARGRLTRDVIARRVSRAPGGAAPSRRVSLAAGKGRTLTLAGLDAAEGLDGLIACLERVLAQARRARAKGLTIAALARAMRDEAVKTGGRD